jgi:ribosomal protein L35AE/L33A
LGEKSKKMEKKHVEKPTVVILNQLNIKKINSTKISLKKKHVGKHCSKTKIMWGNILTIHNILKKKTMK